MLAGDIELAPQNDPDPTPLTQRTGLAHLIGIVDLISNGETNNVLVPHGALSIRGELPTGTVTTTVD